MNVRPLLSLLCACLLSAISEKARADLVTDWNDAFLAALRNETTPPPLASRNLAILHLSIYDAVNGITRKHQPFFVQEKPEAGTSAEAAALAAAHQVSVTLYPSQRSTFDSMRRKTLSMLGAGPEVQGGLSWGMQTANAILNWRGTDRSSTSVPYIPKTLPGGWRRTPPYFRPPEYPHWQNVVPFALQCASQFRPPGPPALSSSRYAADCKQVKEIGGRDSNTRTKEQTEIAHFWSDFSYTVTPPGHWNQIAASVASERCTSIEESARLFAMLNVALADAAIAAWDAKYTYNWWRPVTAIQQGDTDGNIETTGDAEWVSLLSTPAFPEYVSGHSAFSGAAAKILAGFFGSNEVPFTVGCDSLPGIVHRYDSFEKAAEEIGMSRIYGGIHFPSANLDGLELGRKIGEWVSKNRFQPVD